MDYYFIQQRRGLS